MRPLLAVAGALALLCGCAERQDSATYCIQTPGKVWGVAPLPAGATATCPESPTVREEVRSGSTRLEQYELSGWQPEPVLRALQAGGFRILSRVPDDGIQDAAVLIRQAGSQDEQVTYVADRMNGNTLVSITARGEH